MDWTMVNNAKSPSDRVRTIFYLCKLRYEESADVAGERLAREGAILPLCHQSMLDIKAELAFPTNDLAMVDMTDEAVRQYLRGLVEAFDREAEKSV